MLAPGETMTVSADALSSGRAGRCGDLPGDGDIPASWSALPATFGPFTTQARIRVETLAGAGVSVAIA
jgi:hypothetical protein